MAAKGSLTVRIIADASKFKSGLSEADAAASKFSRQLDATGDKMVRFGKGMSLAVTAPVLLGFNKMVNAASNLEQSVGAVDSVFGKSGRAIEEWGRTAEQAAGLSKREVNEMAAVLGASLQGLGFETEASASKVVELQKRGADLAATFGGTTKQALEAIASLMRGERDPIERYGVSIKQVDVSARAAAMGLDTSTAAAKKKSEAVAALDLLMEQTSKTTGQFAREMDSEAGASARLQAKLENVSAAIGRHLLPVKIALAEAAAKVLEGFNNLSPAAQKFLLLTGGLAAAIGPLALILGGMAKAVAASVTAFNAARGAVEMWQLRMHLAKMEGLNFRQALVGSLNPAMLGIGAALAAGVIAINLWAKSKRDAKQATEEYTAALDADSGAIADNTRELAFNRLERDGMIEVAQKLSIAIDDVVDAALGDEKATRRVTAAVEEHVAAAKDDIGAYTSLVTQRELNAVKAQQLTKEIAAETEAVGRATDAMDRKTEALGDTTGATETAEAATDDLTGAMSDAKSTTDLFKAALDRLFGAKISAQEAAINYEDAIDGLTESIKENGDNLDINTEKGRANHGAVIRAIEAAGDYAQSLMDEGFSLDAASAKTQVYIQRLLDTARQSGMTQEQIDELIKTYGLTPKEIKTMLSADTTTATEDISRYKRHLEGIPRSVSTTVTTVRQEVHGGLAYPSTPTRPRSGGRRSGGRARARAHGGPVWPGEDFIVGEEGPERVRFGRTGRVVDAATTAATTGGKVENHYHFDFSGLLVADKRELERVVVEAVVAANRRQGPLPITIRS